MGCSNCDENNNQGGAAEEAKEELPKSFMERVRSLMKVNKNRNIKKNRN